MKRPNIQFCTDEIFTKITNYISETLGIHKILLDKTYNCFKEVFLNNNISQCIKEELKVDITTLDYCQDVISKHSNYQIDLPVSFDWEKTKL